MSKAVLPVDILKHLSLSARNTFGLPAVAEYFCECRTEDDLLEGLEFARTEQLPITVLGGGSNLVLKDAVPGLVLAINTKGISASGDQVRFAAGENWHQSVCWAIEQGRYGLENLSLIPGNVGAAPIQNIGAYGVSVSMLSQENQVSVSASLMQIANLAIETVCLNNRRAINLSLSPSPLSLIRYLRLISLIRESRTIFMSTSLI